jgi:hypothetical protein
MRINNFIDKKTLIIVLAVGCLILYFPVKKIILKYKLNVVEKVDLNLDYELYVNDIGDYLNFIRNNRKHSYPVSQAYFENQIIQANKYPYEYNLTMPVEDLKEKIIEELKIGFLLKDINRRRLKVTTVAVKRHNKYNENELLFNDPLIGTFFVRILIPNGNKKSYPSIIGLHGHNDSSKEFRDKYFGKTLAAENGFIVIMPSFRAMNLDKNEETISRKLYLHGFTLMGLRVYETFLVVKYLKYKSFADNNNIAVMGHSGGSGASVLLSRINPDIKALVYDMKAVLNTPFGNRIHCETVPRLAYYKSQINNFSNLNIPYKRFEYGYKKEKDEQKVIDFFKKHLSDK